VFADIDPVTLNLDPQAAAAAVTERTRRCCRSHLRLPRRHAGVRALAGNTAWGSSRTPARRSAPPCRRHAGRRRGHPAVFGFYANKQLTTGEGGMVTLAAPSEGADRLRAQPGPRARHGLARPRPAGLQLPPQRHRLRSASPSSSAWTDARRAHGWPSSTARRWPGSRGSSCRARTPTETGAAGSSSSSSCPGGRPRRDRARAAGARHPEQALPAGDPPDELLPRALRAPRGRVPVCEDVAARRSLALPFFPGMTEGQVPLLNEACSWNPCPVRSM
jgi:perosamine synthetase